MVEAYVKIHYRDEPSIRISEDGLHSGPLTKRPPFSMNPFRRAMITEQAIA